MVSHTYTQTHTHKHTHICMHSLKKKVIIKMFREGQGWVEAWYGAQGPGLTPQHQKLNRKQSTSLRSQILGKRGQKDQEFKVVFGDLVSLRPLAQKQNKTKNKLLI